MLKLFFIAFTLVTLINVTVSTELQTSESWEFNSTLSCGDWHPYKEEKCFKYIYQVSTQTFDDAIRTCREIDPTASLITIRTQEEQVFLWNYIFEIKKVADSAWIGLNYSGLDNHREPIFKWIDGTNYTYRNWVDGKPNNQSDRLCVEIKSPQESSGELNSKGNWQNVRCEKKNAVICQKMQTWTLGMLQKILLESTQKTREEFEALKNKLSATESKLSSTQEAVKKTQETQQNEQQKLKTLESNPVPIGFIYVQLPNQPEPKALWSSVQWADVSSDYAGLFFRVVGNSSASFGEIQNENSPRITAVRYRNNGNNKTNAEYRELKVGSWSERIFTGGNLDYHCSLEFNTSSGEVRPRNKATRIWKRIK